MSAQPDYEVPEPLPETPKLVAVPRSLAPQGSTAPLKAARIRRKLSEEQVAERAGLFPDEVRWLEEGRVYRFTSTEDAVLASVLYTAALGISPREARRLAGFAEPPRSHRSLVRAAVLGALLLSIALAIVLPGVFGRGATAPSVAPAGAVPSAARAPGLPPPSAISVDVFNGSGDINWTARVAAAIGKLGYRVDRVARASRFDYPETAVYFEPGGEPLAHRLAQQLGVIWKPLPGGSNPKRLVVIVGPQTGPG